MVGKGPMGQGWPPPMPPFHHHLALSKGYPGNPVHYSMPAGRSTQLHPSPALPTKGKACQGPLWHP